MSKSRLDALVQDGGKECTGLTGMVEVSSVRSGVSKISGASGSWRIH